MKPVPETREALTSRMTYGDPGAAVARARSMRSSTSPEAPGRLADRAVVAAHTP